MEVNYSRKMKIEHNGYHQSDLHIKMNGSNSRITILATQPVYPSIDGKGFELADLTFTEIMCYRPFDCKKVICHDLTSARGFEKSIRNKLGSLENPS